MPSMNFVCIECGARAKELFKTYGSGILKLTECVECGKSVDKYVEFDGAVLCLDLLLLKKSAFRHYLFNARNKNLWKLLLFLVLFEAFRQWRVASNSGVHFSLANDSSDEFSETSFSEPPWEFYAHVMRVSLDVALFLLSVVSMSWFSRVGKNLVLDAFVLASFGELLTVIACLWDAGPGFILMAVVFSLACQAQAHSVVTSWSCWMSATVVTLSFLFTRISPWRYSVLDGDQPSTDVPDYLFIES